ncbi:hypothetical protein EUX98_g8155 [Antrodiella citrinella]|uniref:Uncharacterized protein n=1 Tax=Antrodiella citrinella TaxID=2447956 RepID=A0A4S4MAS0_9APHY|nr:hypothetical protein EUX98_g8155 [Antrodiella citrinella]
MLATTQEREDPRTRVPPHVGLNLSELNMFASVDKLSITSLQISESVLPMADNTGKFREEKNGDASSARISDDLSVKSVFSSVFSGVLDYGKSNEDFLRTLWTSPNVDTLRELKVDWETSPKLCRGLLQTTGHSISRLHITPQYLTNPGVDRDEQDFFGLSHCTTLDSLSFTAIFVHKNMKSTILDDISDDLWNLLLNIPPTTSQLTINFKYYYRQSFANIFFIEHLSWCDIDDHLSGLALKTVTINFLDQSGPTRGAGSFDQEIALL